MASVDRSSNSRSPRGGKKFGHPVVVADILDTRLTLVCSAGSSLRSAAQLLLSGDRTSAAVVDGEGRLLGAITENDILNAYVETTPFDQPVECWLQSGHARLPACSMATLAVRPRTPVVEAAAFMQSQTLSELASHHVVVRDEDDKLVGILSSLDLARASCGAGVQLPCAKQGKICTVGRFMKTRSVLPVLSKSSTFDEVFRALISAKQNCLLIAEDIPGSPGVVDVVTSRAALRAFVDQIPGTTVAFQWLRGKQRSLFTRMVREDMRLQDAAEMMTAHAIHHLVVVSPANSSVTIGVLSASDLAYAIAFEQKEP